ncbi:hypothetical protein [Prescottella agglutinans]|uniref:Replication protein n=1 Tax=Prescottella agglutinans TaxID=1644129 RepID=A0ABT6MFR4_9NOCA|nr:hypothetical protein [Prescottella agglutinans]MDH6283133.1 hypothetical protein [Prescottella agglutinans]
MTDEARYYRNAAAQVLALCASKDPWFPKPDNESGDNPLIYGWAEQFAKHKLDRGDLLEGVRLAYDAHGSGFKPLPADIVGYARKVRRERSEFEGPEARATREAKLDARFGDTRALEPKRGYMPDHLRRQLTGHD